VPACKCWDVPSRIFDSEPQIPPVCGTRFSSLLNRSALHLFEKRYDIVSALCFDHYEHAPVACYSRSVLRRCVPPCNGLNFPTDPSVLMVRYRPPDSLIYRGRRKGAPSVLSGTLRADTIQSARSSK
jgi:hypothetical protein